MQDTYVHVVLKRMESRELKLQQENIFFLYIEMLRKERFEVVTN